MIDGHRSLTTRAPASGKCHPTVAVCQVCVIMIDGHRSFTSGHLYLLIQELIPHDQWPRQQSVCGGSRESGKVMTDA